MRPGSVPAQLTRLAALLDEQAGRYRQLNHGRHLGEQLARPRTRQDEELLAEPILKSVIERVLGFPPDAYFPQLGRSGLKPDFTPIDLVAHRFVLDAKGSTQELAGQERQIRAYVDQRQLDYGVLFDLRELRVYRREVARRQDEIDDALEVGRRLVEAVERLVCPLYGVPDPLTDLVVESAVARAGTVAQSEQ